VELFNRLKMTIDNLPIEEDISQLRVRIDELDAQIAHLLVVRTQIAQKVAASKANDAKLAGEELGFGWRPKREVEIIRQIQSREPSLGKRLSYMVWRAMITRNLANQAPMEVIAVEKSLAPSRIGFGAAIVPQLIDNAIDAIKIATEKENLILSLPWPDETQNWWHELIKPQFKDLKINMGLPHVEDVTPEALCLAKITPLETGNDYSLIAIKSDKKPLFEGVKISNCGQYDLYKIKGFHQNLDDIENDVHFLGAYAIV
jgi:chorismate mutase